LLVRLEANRLLDHQLVGDGTRQPSQARLTFPSAGEGSLLG
jgi:hypothetical protein